MTIDQNKGFKKKSTCADGRHKVWKKWVPLIHGHVKLNVYGAYSKSQVMVVGGHWYDPTRSSRLFGGHMAPRLRLWFARATPG
jgi:hypothetical protein